MPENPTLLGPGEPVSVERLPGGGRVLLICDHASNRVPGALGRLGLDEAMLARHIGWDIGAGAVTRGLAALLGAPAILSAYSRLAIDCNRDPADASSIPETSDGVAIPGNRDLAPAARAARRAALFEPYHAAISSWIEASLAHGTVPALLSVHSFTPALGGKARPWHAGILWDGDGRIAGRLMAALRGDVALVVGDNEPYSARRPAGYTMRHHALRRGLPHAAIEVRQDGIADAKGAAAWAARLASALKPLLADPSLYRLWQK